VHKTSITNSYSKSLAFITTWNTTSLFMIYAHIRLITLNNFFTNKGASWVQHVHQNILVRDVLRWPQFSLGVEVWVGVGMLRNRCMSQSCFEAVVHSKSRLNKIFHWLISTSPIRKVPHHLGFSRFTSSFVESWWSPENQEFMANKWKQFSIECITLESSRFW
jgi:hypothetical protein